MNHFDGPKLVINHEDLPPESSEPKAPERKTDPMAILSASLGVVSVLFAGVIFGPLAFGIGAIAWNRRRLYPPSRTNFSRIGMTTGLVGTLIWAIGIGWFLFHQKTIVQHTQQSGWNQTENGNVDLAAIERTPLHIKRALLAHVSIVVERLDGNAWSMVTSGSGVMVSSSQGEVEILTCRHVIESAIKSETHRIRARWLGGRAESIQISWSSTPDLDLAVLHGSGSPNQALPPSPPVGDATTLAIGDEVFAVGDPLNFRASFIRGGISAIRTHENSSSIIIIQSQIPLNPGNSGGGLYNSNGELIGINSWRLKDSTEGMGFSVSINNLWNYTNKMPKNLADIFNNFKMNNINQNQKTSQPQKGK